MNILGWGLFAVGGLLLFSFAFIGLDSGGGNVANLAGTLTGVAMMISGAVFVAGERIERAVRGGGSEHKVSPTENTEPTTAPETETSKSGGSGIVVIWIVATAGLIALLAILSGMQSV